MSNFLKYLYLKSLEYIRAYHTNRNKILDNIGDYKSFILSLPNR